MSIAKKLAGYMPKARNREFDPNNGFTQTEIELREENAASYNLQDNSDLNQIRAQAASAVSKTSASLWLQNRRNPGSDSSSNALSNSGLRRSLGDTPPSRYASSQLPSNGNDSDVIAGRHMKSTAAPKTVSKDHNQESKEIVPEVALAGKSMQPSMQVANANSRNSMLMKSKFAKKPNSLVRQCQFCQMLFSNSHICEDSMKARSSSMRK